MTDLNAFYCSRDQIYRHLRGAALAAGNQEALERLPLTTTELKAGVDPREMFTDDVPSQLTRAHLIALGYPSRAVY